MRVVWRAGLFLTSAISVMLGSAMAKAADLGPAPMEAPVWNWTGIYLGLEAGGGLGHAVFDVRDCSFCNEKNDPEGVLAGGQLVGLYQFQGTPFIVGAEIDGGWTDFQDDGDIFGIVNTETKVRDLAMAKGELGWAPIDRAYVYGTGGFAGAETQARASIPLIRAKWEDSKFVDGWTWGAGARYVIGDVAAQNWPGAIIVGVEWDHIQLNRTDFSSDLKFKDGGPSYGPAEYCEYCKSPKIKTDANLDFDVISASVAVKF